MHKISLFFIFFTLISINALNAQDTLINKKINTNKFNMEVDTKSTRFESLIYFVNNNSITPATDSSFYLGDKRNGRIILYKHIEDIVIQGNRRTYEGIWKGGLTGGIAGIMAMTVFSKTFFPTSKVEGGGGFIFAIFYESLFILSGSAIGGLIGSFYIETDKFDLTKYPENQRKEKALSVFLKYRLNL